MGMDKRCSVNHPHPQILDTRLACDFRNLILEAENARHEEPRSLEISYMRSVEEGKTKKEIVFEDPGDLERQPRLLVSMQAVLALRSLCERDAVRVEFLTQTLNQCRVAYYKELLYLREQLVLAASPSQMLKHQAVMNYEVHWFNPPNYIDDALRDYLMNCIRITHKQLIEELHELQTRLQGKPPEDMSDVAIRGLVRKFGAAGLLKQTHAIVNSKQDGSPVEAKGLEDAALELYSKVSDAKTLPKGPDPAIQLELSRLTAEIQKLKKANAALEADLDSARQGAGSEKSRADAERVLVDQETARAEAERARAMQAEEELGSLRNVLQQAQGEFIKLQKTADSATPDRKSVV